MQTILELKGVYKDYKRGKIITPALRDINYTLNAGDDMAVVGTSGSGKTTLLNIIGGLDKPTKGTVLIDGKDTSKMNDQQLSKFRSKTVGFIFQFFNLQDYLNAQENVMVPMLFAGTTVSSARTKALELLDKVGLKDRASYYPKHLSGGEMQRVAVARSLANDPKILLADEPTANLDRTSANKVMDLFAEINTNGVSVIVITHDSQVSSRFKHILHISDGQVESKS